MAMPRGAGALRERITLLRYEKVKDGMGGHTETEHKLVSLWAQVAAVQARDNVIADQTRELRTHEVVIRAAAYPVQQGDIVLWRGSRLVVKATRPLTHWLFLDCITEVR